MKVVGKSTGNCSVPSFPHFAASGSKYRGIYPNLFGLLKDSKPALKLGQYISVENRQG
jgi:hypothetical protein